MMSSFRLFVSLLLFAGVAQAATTLYCTTVEDIYDAMVTVQAGDEIVIAPGVYLADTLAISGTGAHFASYADGTEQAPIVMRSEDANNPAILRGENAGSLSCIRIFGAFWKLHNLVVTNAQKGIVFDNAPFGEVINCTIYGVGYEAIHWRDGSDFGLIDGCRIYDTGITSPGFGEAIYIGTDKGSWGKYDRDVTYVTIRNCDIGPGIAAEAFDIKEGTEEITVEYNTIDATGISNANYADSFIDLKGTRAYIRYNTFRRNNEVKLTRGIAVIDRGVALSSYEHVIHDNIFELNEDGSGINMVDAYSGTSDIYAFNNVRVPAEGDAYSSSINDFCCPPWYAPPDDGTCFSPLYFAADQITNTSVSFSWSGGASALSYTLVYASADGTVASAQVSGLTDETFLLQDLLVDTIYIAQVQASCESGSSSFSTQVAFRTLSNDVDPDDTPIPPEGVVVVYDDTLAFGWNEHSFTGRYDLTESISTHEGLHAIKATFGNYGGLQLKHDGLPASSFSYLHFWVRDDVTNGPTSPVIQLEVNSVEYDFVIEAAGWHLMMVPIEENTITKIVFQNRSPNSRVVYFDAIELWPEETSSSAPTMSSIPSGTPSAMESENPPTSMVPSTAPIDVASDAPSDSIPSFTPYDSSSPTITPTQAPTKVAIDPSASPSAATMSPVMVPSSSPVAPTPSPTSSPDAVGESASVVFGDALGSEWTDYSYKGSYYYSETIEVYDGTASIRADYSGWGALHIKDNNGLDTTGLTSLSFIVKVTGTADGIRVKVNGKQVEVSPPIDHWAQVVLPLNLFNDPGSISSVTLQNKSSVSRTVYIDRIEFI